MGDVISTHLDESKRELITARAGEVIGEFGRLYEQQYAVALFNKVRFDIEGGGGPQPQLLHRKVPLQDKSIFSGTLFQYLEENKKWRNRFLFIPDSYNVNFYDSKAGYEKGLHPKGSINCAGYRLLTSMDQYLELLGNSLPGVKAKSSSSPFLKCPTQFPLILWHPYACHYYFCVVAEKDQQKWSAVFQDCVRHTNNGLSEECKVQTPAFTDAVRLYRQTHSQYGTWDMMCGAPPQILANLVMEKLLPELRDLISPRLKGKLQERLRSWMLISDAVYRLVQAQAKAQYEAIVQSSEVGSPPLEASIRTDMDQIITSKEHVTGKIRALVLPKAEKLLKVSIQPYINSILEALMEPTSRGFFEVRDVFFRELVDMNKNLLNDGSKEQLGEHMEKISMLAFHPVKMQCCFEKVEQLSLEGLQQRFDVTSPSVFVQRAQILMREQMDDAVYTFEQLLRQGLEGQEGDDLCKVIHRCQDRVIKKFDYDSSTVRKRFFREALLQIFIPYMLKQLSPSCSPELPHFQELIFEDFSRFILVENIFEEVVLHTVMKDIMMAVKEAAVQRKHNLYRDSIVLTNSDPNLHLLSENPPIDWATEYGEKEQEEDGEGVKQDAEGNEDGDPEVQKRRRMKQVVSMIQVEASGVPGESCVEVPGVEDIPEETAEEVVDRNGGSEASTSPDLTAKVPNGTRDTPSLANGIHLKEEDAPVASGQDEQSMAQAKEASQEDAEKPVAESPPADLAIERAIQESPPADLAIESAIQESPPADLAIESAIQESPPADLAIERAIQEIPPADLAIESAIQEIENAVLEEEDGEPSAEPSTLEEAAETLPAHQEPDGAPPNEEEPVSKDQEQSVAAAKVDDPTTTPQEAENKPPSQQQVAPESTSESPAESDQPTGDSPAGQSENSSLQSPAAEATEEEPQPVQAPEKHSDSVEEDSGKGVSTDPVVANEM
ncbi:protein Niban 2-like isoform X1 [Clupea harengus]|uniref:Protein Niban 2-like isoform X1 n=1 Tax=Clupea harengus TaxID=7950 RepID=A0A8M1KFP0_CLUHA|nr:protein Niban 2-like isoform X1 [Clupea harengus]